MTTTGAYLLHRRRDMRGYVLRMGQGYEAAELDKKKISLVERVKQGHGHPTKLPAGLCEWIDVN